MQNVQIHISCIGKEVNAQMLLTFGNTLFCVAELLWRELSNKVVLELDDQIIWDVQVKGSNRDYTAHGNLLWTKKGTGERISCFNVDFKDQKMSFQGGSYEAPTVSIINQFIVCLEGKVGLVC